MNAEQIHGRMLYQPEWAEKKKFKDASNIIMGSIVIALGAILALMFLYFGLKEENAAAALMIFMGAFVMALGYTMVRTEARKMPFRIYESGITKPTVSFSRGLKRMEEIIPWADIRAVSINSSPFYSVQIKSIKIECDTEGDIELYYNDLDDPLTVMKLLKRFVPEKMSPEFNIYVGSREERALVKPPIDYMKKSSGTTLISFVLFPMLAFITALFLGPDMRRNLIEIAVTGPIIVLFGILMYHLGDREFTDSMSACEPTESGLKVKPTFFVKYLSDYPKLVPYSAIRTIRLKLEPLFFSHICEIELITGERYKSNMDVYLSAAEREEFVLRDFDLVNRKPAPAPDRKFFAKNPRKYTLFMILLTMPIMFILPLIVQSPEIPENSFRFFALLILGTIVPLWLYLHMVIAKRTRLSERLFADDRGIRIPDLPGKMNFIPRDEFITAQVGKDIYGYYCKIISRKGEVKLSQLARDKLLQAGYPVTDAEEPVIGRNISPETQKRLPFNLEVPQTPPSYPLSSEHPEKGGEGEINPVYSKTPGNITDNRETPPPPDGGRITLHAGWNGPLSTGVSKKDLKKIRLYTFGLGSLFLILGLSFREMCLFALVGGLFIFLGIVVEYARRKPSLNGTSIDIPENAADAAEQLTISLLGQMGENPRLMEEKGKLLKGNRYMTASGIMFTFFRMKQNGTRGQRIFRLRISNITEENIQRAIKLQIELDRLFLENRIGGMPILPVKTEYVWRDGKLTAQK